MTDPVSMIVGFVAALPLSSAALAVVVAVCRRADRLGTVVGLAAAAVAVVGLGVGFSYWLAKGPFESTVFAFPALMLSWMAGLVTGVAAAVAALQVPARPRPERRGFPVRAIRPPSDAV